MHMEKNKRKLIRQFVRKFHLSKEKEEQLIAETNEMGIPETIDAKVISELQAELQKGKIVKVEKDG
jgi:hypothetical protein